MAYKYKIKNDILTVKNFSDFLAMALDGVPTGHYLKIKMNLRIIHAFPTSKNPIKRLIQIRQNNVRRHARLAKQYDAKTKGGSN